MQQNELFNDRYTALLFITSIKSLLPATCLPLFGYLYAHNINDPSHSLCMLDTGCPWCAEVIANRKPLTHQPTPHYTNDLPCPLVNVTYVQWPPFVCNSHSHVFSDFREAMLFWKTATPTTWFKGVQSDAFGKFRWLIKSSGDSLHWGQWRLKGHLIFSVLIFILPAF